MKKRIYLILTIIILMISMNVAYAEANNEKTIIITLDQMDFVDAEELINENLSMGLLNIKTSGKNAESLFMTIATGRKVTIPDGIFTGVSRENEKAFIESYDEIRKSLDKSYPNFSQQMSFLGTEFEKKNINTAYIGGKNKAESLMISNDVGKIDYWEEISYDGSEFEASSREMLEKSDILLISFDINGDKDRLKVLSEFLDQVDNHRLIVFPKLVSGDLGYRLNSSMVPIFYKADAVGAITSKSTRRDLVITSLDLLPTIASHHDLDLKSSIGNKIEIYRETDLIEASEGTLLEFLNLNIVKYILHGFVTVILAYAVYIYKFKDKNFNNIRVLFNAVILSILISIILGGFHLHRSIVLYTLVLLGSSLVISLYLEKKDIKALGVISAMTNALILLFVFLKPSHLYNSFIGYNSIVAGGRFYGFNNEIMGVLITTSIMVYCSVKEKLEKKRSRNIFIMFYFPIVIIALTGNFGANFGGFLTSIVVFLILLYLSLFDRKMSKKNLFYLFAIGTMILIFSLYLDIKGDDGSHAGDLIERINILGIYELIDMIVKKIKQLIFTMIIPPWNIGFLTQVYLITSKFKEIKKNRNAVPIKFTVMFIASFVALLINDTGVVAFVYMNTYLISNVLEER